MKIVSRLTTAVLVGALCAGAAFAKDSSTRFLKNAAEGGLAEVSMSELAMRKTGNPKIKEFAETMVRDHAAVNTQALALVKKLGVTPQANPISASLSADAAAKLSQYAKLDGAAFDRAYVQNEIAYHRTVNGALEATLIPSAQNPELKGLLQTGLTLFRAHQQHAEHLAAAVK